MPASPLVWQVWTAQFLFLAATSFGAFLLALPGRAFGHPHWQRVSRLGLLVALACGVAAPVALLAGLAQPARALTIYARGNGSSAMTSVAWMLPCYLGALVVFAWTTLRRDLAAAEGPGLRAKLHRIASLGGGGAPRLRLLAMIAAAGCGLGLLICGARVLTAVPARELWNTPLLPWIFAVAGLAGALGLALVLDRSCAPAGSRTLCEPRMTALLAWGTVAALAILAGLGWGWMGGSPVVTALAGAAGLALLPALLRAGWLVGGIAAASGWGMDWVVLAGGQSLPGSSVADLLPDLPALSGLLGATGLLLFLVIALAGSLPVLGPHRPGRA
ncbi:Tetrathionate reductase subunit C [Rhodovastum atsumiense]|uniref:Tetrathionate reductase n=1 Tax=Rhodovastum atsumiense TaxID=504468 RepID=A0A5M6IP92_9PROT|nr:NrfD/PsrC family molybdoenzyme membrane anchor subunit [Rhodovastum atsumiense]KAA5609719.1 tetrathionate reductase [Rhodovastum atsumiense]CAH2604488.1 Tetrathionate reductase subunit C [Rhodovastum atsumiense]